MCAACGVPTHIPVLDPEPEGDLTSAAQPIEGAPAAGSVKFAALRNRSCRPCLGGAALAMMADNIEHVITYWVIWEKFHSPALTGFEVISHWLPFLLLSPYFGALADRYDCRKLIQASQALFMAVSLTWGILFLTNSRTVGNPVFLLILHGMARQRQPPPAGPRRPGRPGGRPRAGARARPDPRNLGQHRVLPAADHPDGAD